jgi:acyl-coenzyme A thioesterase PaaI-like protein
MKTDDDNPILAHWQTLGRHPLGRLVFSVMVGVMAPYSATIRARVQSLAAGHAVVTMRDRRRVRNHLRSIHAAALMNLAELTGGLLSTVSIPADARMIIFSITIDFVKKARGLLTAEGRCEVPQSNAKAELPVLVTIRDQSGDEVARATVVTLIGPKPAS